ncbi:MarC family integral membrane protein [Epsilonproteobacteria bacterium SCGC AD-308-O04]|nr:MarC family integral membrane protein [Epsilonproteobacteria bacterium SCGC AD-308-O04]
MALFSIIILMVSLTIFPFLLLSKTIGDRIGNTGLNIATRVMGLFLAAISVKFILEGTLHFLKVNL